MTGAEYEYRTGIGTDIHRLTAGRDLKLGGIHIPYPLGLLGHSDGDVLIHAVIDAILGATCRGDIGTLFPESDDRWKDFDSRDFAIIVKNQLNKEKWEIVNIDTIIHAEEPRLEPHKGQIKRNMAEIFSVDFSFVNIKAKTNEGLGDIGQAKAISATAIVMLRRRLKSYSLR